MALFFNCTLSDAKQVTGGEGGNEGIDENEEETSAHINNKAVDDGKHL